MPTRPRRHSPPGAAACRRPVENRPHSAARGYDRHWRKVRLAFLYDHPVCATPGCNQPAVDVHHKDSKGPHGPRGFDETNLEALCHPCHSRVTGKEKRGGAA